MIPEMIGLMGDDNICFSAAVPRVRLEEFDGLKPIRPIAYRGPAAKTEEPRPLPKGGRTGAARLTDVGFLDGKMQRVWRYGHFGSQTGDGRRNLDRAFLWRVRPM
jgi:hypothetical protein